MLIKDILINAQESIRNPEKWFNAKTPLEDRSGRLCVGLAVVHQLSDSLKYTPAVGLCLAPLMTAMGQPGKKHFSSLYAYNDSHSHEEVMIWFDQAIAIAEGEIH